MIKAYPQKNGTIATATKIADGWLIENGNRAVPVFRKARGWHGFDGELGYFYADSLASLAERIAIRDADFA